MDMSNSTEDIHTNGAFVTYVLWSTVLYLKFCVQCTHKNAFIDSFAWSVRVGKGILS